MASLGAREEAGVRERWRRGPSYRALGVDAAQVGLEVAHAPAAVTAQLQVAVALVGALHQQRDGLGLDLHIGCAVGSAALREARQAAPQPPASSATTVRVSGTRAPASRSLYSQPAPGPPPRTRVWLPPVG